MEIKIEARAGSTFPRGILVTSPPPQELAAKNEKILSKQ